MQLSKRQLCELIPHQGSMCLLDKLVSWNEQEIVCSSKSHLSQINPLKDKEGLSSVNGIEYAAQAIAIHASLNQYGDVSRSKSHSGFLVQVKNIKFKQCDLSTFPHALQIEAVQVFTSPTSLIYSFSISHQKGHESDQVMTGRIMIFMQESAEI